MKNVLTALCLSSCLVGSIASAQTTVFDHDFENATSGDLSAGGALGTATAGMISATGGHISDFVPLENFGSQGTTYTSASNGASNAITTVADGSFNDVGTPAGNFVTADLSSPAAITGGLGSGQTTTVDFTLGAFGTNNPTNFKYFHAIGESSAGAEVFHILYRSGSGGGTREAYAREFGEDNTTFEGGSFSSVDGTQLLDGVAFHMNSTDATTTPAGYISVSITIDENGWDASAINSRGANTFQQDATGLGIASGATDLASIDFFTSHNGVVSNENKGFWLDSILVQTDLTVEPSGLPGDYDNDNDVDADDIDLLSAQLGNPASVNPLMNLDTDDTITLADHDLHITTLVQDANGTGALIGDLNFDGDVDVSQIDIGGGGVVNVGDASVLLANLGTETGAGYAQGDLNGDGDVDVSQIAIGPGGVVNLGDASILLANLGQSTEAAPAASAVPEPGSLSLLAVAAIGLVSRRKRS